MQRVDWLFYVGRRWRDTTRMSCGKVALRREATRFRGLFAFICPVAWLGGSVSVRNAPFYGLSSVADTRLVLAVTSTATQTLPQLTEEHITYTMNEELIVLSFFFPL